MFQILRARTLRLLLHQRDHGRDDRAEEGSTLQHHLLGKVFWKLDLNLQPSDLGPP